MYTSIKRWVRWHKAECVATLVGMLFILFMLILCIFCEKVECDNYQEVTGRYSTYLFIGGCYVENQEGDMMKLGDEYLAYLMGHK